MNPEKPYAVIVIAAILAIPPGCGSASGTPQTTAVRGRITYQGKPVTRGTVSFLSAAGVVAVATIQPDGSYALGTFGPADGAVAGQYQVGIIADDGDPSLMPGTPGYRTPKDLVPKKYNNPTRSGLTVEVTPETRPIDFDLKP